MSSVGRAFLLVVPGIAAAFAAASPAQSSGMSSPACAKSVRARALEFRPRFGSPSLAPSKYVPATESAVAAIVVQRPPRRSLGREAPDLGVEKLAHSSETDWLGYADALGEVLEHRHSYRDESRATRLVC